MHLLLMTCVIHPSLSWLVDILQRLALGPGKCDMFMFADLPVLPSTGWKTYRFGIALLVRMKTIPAPAPIRMIVHPDGST